MIDKDWVTADGQELYYHEMSDSHLQNAIKLQERRLSEKPDYMIYIGDADMAEMAVDQENAHNDRLADEIEQSIIDMKAELANRKFK